jgi:hypothetical protein
LARRESSAASGEMSGGVPPGGAFFSVAFRKKASRE